jgi:hypothetical protein
MREFFNDWRRKLGVVTLVMACVFAAWWLRSFRTEDSFFYPNGPYITDSLFSIAGSIGWSRDDESVWDMQRDRRDYGFRSRRSVGRPFLMYPEVSQWRWAWYWNGLGCGCGADGNGGGADIWIFPYWSIVTPLVLLSAWLLLTKPRKIRPRAVPHDT